MTPYLWLACLIHSIDLEKEVRRRVLENHLYFMLLWPLQAHGARKEAVAMACRQINGVPSPTPSSPKPQTTGLGLIISFMHGFTKDHTFVFTYRRSIFKSPTAAAHTYCTGHWLKFQTNNEILMHFSHFCNKAWPLKITKSWENLGSIPDILHPNLKAVT